MQTLITVGIIVLVFALITAILIPVMNKMTQNAELEYELRRDGVTVQGHVIGRYEHVYYTRGGKQIDFMLKYSYLYDGVSYQREADLLESDYQAHREGTEISVYTGPKNLNTKGGWNKIYSRHDEKTVYRRLQGKSGTGTLEGREDLCPNRD